MIAQGFKRACLGCFRREGGDNRCKCAFAHGGSSAELTIPGDVSDDENANKNDDAEPEPGAQDRSRNVKAFTPKDKDRPPLSPEEAARLRAHMAGMFRRYATLLGEYGEEIQDPDPNRVHVLPLEVIQDQIRKVQGSKICQVA